jgi:hypothetical protein
MLSFWRLTSVEAISIVVYPTICICKFGGPRAEAGRVPTVAVGRQPPAAAAAPSEQKRPKCLGRPRACPSAAHVSAPLSIPGSACSGTQQTPAPSCLGQPAYFPFSPLFTMSIAPLYYTAESQTLTLSYLFLLRSLSTSSMSRPRSGICFEFHCGN